MLRIVAFAFLFALAAAGIAVAICFTHDLSEAHRRIAGRSQTVETSFGQLEYAAIGSGDEVLVVHGASGGFDQSLDMTGALAHQGFRVIAPSRFGYLRSAMPSHPTLASQADAYAELLDHLHVGKVVVVGISAGAWSSLEFAIRHPERCRALVLLVPANYLPPNVKIHGGLVAQAIFESDFAAWAALKLTPLIPGAMVGMMLGTDPSVVARASSSEKARIQKVLDNLLPITPRANGIAFDLKTAATQDPLPVGQITCPVLAISAQDDRFNTAVRAKWIAEHVPHGRAIVFPTGGHALVGDYADVLNEAVRFMRSSK